MQNNYFSTAGMIEPFKTKTLGALSTTENARSIQHIFMNNKRPPTIEVENGFQSVLPCNSILRIVRQALCNVS